MRRPIPRARTNGADRSTSSTWSQSSSPCSTAGARRMVPALLTRMSTGRSEAASVAASSVAACRSARSTRYGVNVRPSASTRRATSLPSGSNDALTPMMSAPAAASASAIARPMPRRQPVTTARRPMRSNGFIGDRPTVDEDLDRGSALQRGERLADVGQRDDGGDEPVGRHRAGGEQADGLLEVGALVDAHAQNLQLPPEDPVQVDLPRRRVDRNDDKPAPHREDVDGRPDAGGGSRYLEGHVGTGTRRPLLDVRGDVRRGRVDDPQAEFLGDGPAVLLDLDDHDVGSGLAG